ncbi:MAG: hypothetical protein PUD92_08970 [Clostridiales bacterium]|nr:hypothetical protein [Clostridiales bacterium]
MRIKKENIEILSRNQIEELALSPFPPNTALISVRDTDKAAPKLKNKPMWHLQLVFDDISSDETEDYKEQEYTLFSEQTAQQIAYFVICHKDTTERIICQCEYGQSRSAAIAAALLEFFYKSGIEIFADDRYFPNKLVFRLTLQALIKRG